MLGGSRVSPPVMETLVAASTSGGKGNRKVSRWIGRILGICLASSLLEFLIVGLQNRRSM